MSKEQTRIMSGIVILAIYVTSFVALTSISLISMKALAQNTSSGNVSMVIANKTAANSDVLMTKVRNMGNSNTTTSTATTDSKNMTNQTSD